ncbi:MAG TPA: metal ABC transporter ATP-binding protein [Gammaproteobacteria bacterium]|nr:metal ABC transporter ATP-binding protein [Gammaproteobacteria bacterium]
MPEIEPLLAVSDLGVKFNERWVLKHVSFKIQPKEIVTLIGPNGCGKTTLVKTMLGLLKPSNGQITRAAGLKIGYMPQRFVIEPTLPIRVARFLQLSHSQIDTEEELFHTLGIAQLLQTELQHLSGGEMQRVLMAYALLGKPNLLVLDEPIQGVDVGGQIEFYQLLYRLRDYLSCSIFMVSHDLHLVMANTDRVICLNQHICCQGKPESVLSDPAYLALFGESAAQSLALYSHKHDHHHTLAGEEKL